MWVPPHLYFDISGHKGSFALLSPADDVKRAVIFVHGFNGSARLTWSDFLSLIDHPDVSEWWGVSDVFFFHYQWESVFRQLLNNAVAVYKFIQEIFPKPFDSLGQHNGFRNQHFEYGELILVGHSEGGLLLRKAIILATQMEEDIQDFLDGNTDKKQPPAPTGMLKAKLRLFAPALGGEMLSGLVGIAASLPVISSLLMSSAAKRGMNPSSAEITAPRTYTRDYARYLRFDCYRAHILWAEHDIIVSGEKYERDVQCLNFPKGTHHTNVCKPTRKYLQPLTFVECGVEHDGCK